MSLNGMDDNDFLIDDAQLSQYFTLPNSQELSEFLGCPIPNKAVPVRQNIHLPTPTLTNHILDEVSFKKAPPKENPKGYPNPIHILEEAIYDEKFAIKNANTVFENKKKYYARIINERGFLTSKESTASLKEMKSHMEKVALANEKIKNFEQYLEIEKFKAQERQEKKLRNENLKTKANQDCPEEARRDVMLSRPKTLLHQYNNSEKGQATKPNYNQSNKKRRYS